MNANGAARIQPLQVGRYKRRGNISESTDIVLLVAASLATVPEVAVLAPDDGDVTLLEVGKAQPPAPLQGRIVKISQREIEGWVWDSKAPTKRIRLELIEGDNLLSIVVADKYRQELVHLGCGDGRHGFSIAFEAGLLSEGHYTLSLRCADTGAAMPGSPFIVDFRLPTYPTTSPRGLISDQKILSQAINYLGNLQAGTANIEEAPAVIEDFQQHTLAEPIESGDLVLFQNGLSQPEASLSAIGVSADCGLEDRAGAKHKAIDSGKPADSMLVPASAEGDFLLNFSANDAVKCAYNGVLDRDPEQRGYEIYGDALRSGMRLQDLIAELVRTPEFLNKAKAAHSDVALVTKELGRLSASMERAMLTLAMGAASSLQRQPIEADLPIRKVGRKQRNV